MNRCFTQLGKVCGGIILCSLLATAQVPSQVTELMVAVLGGTPSAGCGTDTNGNPTDNSKCGMTGTSVYTGEGVGITNLTQWCGGALPGNCGVVTSCGQTLVTGSWLIHAKYYLAADLNCGLTSYALQILRYTDVNVNGHTVTGYVYSDAGQKGWHLFNGTVNCSMAGVPTAFLIGTATHYAYSCIQSSNAGGTYTQGGGDQIRIHHLTGSNAFGCVKFMQQDGTIPTPTGGWTEAAVQVYSNDFHSVPVGLECHREYAGVYSETQPVEYFNNRGTVDQSNATQLLVVYGKGVVPTGTFVNYIHNNFLTCQLFALTGGDSCRPILVDGIQNAHIQYNDVWSSNNRCVRMRDAFNTEVDHNYCHDLRGANGYTGVGTHTGDNDINSGQGQVVPINIHDNTFELGPGGLGHLERSQRGTLANHNKYICAVEGCAGAIVFNASADVGVFCAAPCTATVDALAATITRSTGSFQVGTSVKVGSVLKFSGFANAANNVQCTVSAVTAQVLTVAGCAGLVGESSTTARYGGVSVVGEQNYQLRGLGGNVNVNKVTNGPSSTLNACGTPALANTGNGTLNNSGVCP